MKEFILSLDQGTTSSRAIVFDHNGHAGCLCTKGIYSVFIRNPDGWNTIRRRSGRHRPELHSRQLPERILKALPLRLSELQTSVRRQLSGTGKPVNLFIMQLSGRTGGHADFCDQLKADGNEQNHS